MSPRKIIEIGKKFNRLTVLAAGIINDKSNRKHKYYALVQCDCGNKLEVIEEHVRNGNTKSCGCLKIEMIKNLKYNLTHGMKGTDTYSIWAGIKDRCNNPNSTGYKNYGERGIKVCERWHKFDNFYADMGERPEGMSIDRIDSNGDYEPSNCRWTDKYTQARNRNNNKNVLLNGDLITVSQASKILGLSSSTIKNRAKRLEISYQESLDYFLKNPPKK